MDQIDDILSRGVANIIPSYEELTKLLHEGKKLNIYMGIDPTSIKIHLGHAVPLRKLQALSDLGHNVTFLIGDFTALIGDTSDKESERPQLTQDQIRENFKTYKKQAEKLLNFSKIKIVHNSSWLKNLTFADIVKLCQHFSFGDFASRELVRKRLDSGKRVGLHEALYPVMQGYDSYFLDCDLQIGGTDQTFNMQAGRTLQKQLRDKQSYVLSCDFLEGTDGRKMSKTWGNAIWLDDKPDEMYGKIMSLSDNLIIQYFTLATSLPLSDIDQTRKELDQGQNPMSIKKQLAHRIVGEFYGQDSAQGAQANFEAVFQKKELPTSMPKYIIAKNRIENTTFTDVLTASGLAQSKSEARRVTRQGGLQVANQTLENPDMPITNYLEGEQLVIQFGKRKFLTVEVED